MKPSELLKDYGTYGQSKEKKLMKQYGDKECVVAYLKETMGIIFIIKSARKYFAFASLNDELYFGGYDYNLGLMPIKKAVALINGKEKILMDEDYSKIKNLIILNKLDEDEEEE